MTLEEAKKLYGIKDDNYDIETIDQIRSEMASYMKRENQEGRMPMSGYSKNRVSAQICLIHCKFARFFKRSCQYPLKL